MELSETDRLDFIQAMGETFGNHVSPPVSFEDASPHECCEVVWSVLGFDVTPSRLAALTQDDVAALAQRFGEYFEVESPTIDQIRVAVSRTLARWPAGPVGETD